MYIYKYKIILKQVEEVPEQSMHPGSQDKHSVPDK